MAKNWRSFGGRGKNNIPWKINSKQESPAVEIVGGVPFSNRFSGFGAPMVAELPLFQ